MLLLFFLLTKLLIHFFLFTVVKVFKFISIFLYNFNQAFNHVEKAIQTDVGVVICTTKAMKTAGNFDTAVGEFEKFERYLNPLQEVLTAPILLVGLQPPDSFHIDQRKEGRKNVGFVVRHENF
jgi:hypothetical protein